VISRTSTTDSPAAARGDRVALAASWLFGLAIAGFYFALNRADWMELRYETADLATYVQWLDNCLRGVWVGSIQQVPMLGNHADPIVFLLLPFHALWPHPMLPVLAQSALVATMAPLGFAIARRLGLGLCTSACLAAATVLNPGTAFAAIHEFHPETLVAPLLLAVFWAHLAGGRRTFWAACAAVLACKENMALLLPPLCAAMAWDRRGDLGHRELALRYGIPAAAALAWFGLYIGWLQPMWNPGHVGFSTLYGRFGDSGGEIARTLLTDPARTWAHLSVAMRGTLGWGLLVPLLFLPLRKPLWLVPILPIYAQHFLSWRPSEWEIYAHYAAPLVPVLWFAAARALADGEPFERRRFPRLTAALAAAIVLATLVAHATYGLGPRLAGRDRLLPGATLDPSTRLAALDGLAPAAELVLPIPYLAHAATREQLHSLHYLLKGLYSISHQEYAPPASADFLLCDFADPATFDASSGFYHPPLAGRDGRALPSSDVLLHRFLAAHPWSVERTNEIARFRRLPSPSAAAPAPSEPAAAPARLNGGAELHGATRLGDRIGFRKAVAFRLRWRFPPPTREIFPWATLELLGLDGERGRYAIQMGLCAPHAPPSPALLEESWNVVRPPDVPPGRYAARLVFTDRPRWIEAVRKNDDATRALLHIVPVGKLTVE
jgi:hypothetical protein